LGQGLDAGAHDFGDVGAGEDDERDERAFGLGQGVTEGDGGQEVEPEDDHEQRGAADDFGVDQGEIPGGAAFGDAHESDDQAQPEGPEDAAQGQKDAHGQAAQRAVGIGAHEEVAEVVDDDVPMHRKSPASAPRSEGPVCYTD
jgi:hypothetical protein